MPQLFGKKKLTLTGRSYLVFGCLLLANVIVWTVALCLFAPSAAKRRVLSLCLVAWTLGLRHALDADHISAIDNATRQLVAKGQRPLTCGLFFSLGHSSIVIAVTVAIAISTGVANKLNGVSSVGGMIGISISASFLFVLALVNSYILYRILRQQRLEKQGRLPATNDPAPAFGCIARAVRPLLRLIDKPWKMYPIGILFGFGFDTSSEIALLAVSALATTSAGGGIASSEIIVLPCLFTAGMSMVDTLDSIVMLWGYAMPQPGEEHWKRIWRSRQTEEQLAVPALPAEPEDKPVEPEVESTESEEDDEGIKMAVNAVQNEQQLSAKSRPRPTIYTDLSIALTGISIFVAFAISLIEFMGIALEKCESCAAAAESSKGLDGRWWRFWQAMNDNSGYLGAGIVGVMLFCGIVFIAVRKWKARRASKPEEGPSEPEKGQETVPELWRTRTIQLET